MRETWREPSSVTKPSELMLLLLPWSTARSHCTSAPPPPSPPHRMCTWRGLGLGLGLGFGSGFGFGLGLGLGLGSGLRVRSGFGLGSGWVRVRSSPNSNPSPNQAPSWRSSRVPPAAMAWRGGPGRSCSRAVCSTHRRPQRSPHAPGRRTRPLRRGVGWCTAPPPHLVRARVRVRVRVKG